MFRFRRRQPGAAAASFLSGGSRRLCATPCEFSPSSTGRVGSRRHQGFPAERRRSGGGACRGEARRWASTSGIVHIMSSIAGQASALPFTRDHAGFGGTPWAIRYRASSARSPSPNCTDGPSEPQPAVGKPIKPVLSSFRSWTRRSPAATVQAYRYPGHCTVEHRPEHTSSANSLSRGAIGPSPLSSTAKRALNRSCDIDYYHL